MQSITTDSIDINSIRGRMLEGSEPSYQGLRSAQNALQYALSQPNRRPNDQFSLMPEDDSGLPSTVPESLDVQPHAANAPKKMSQADDTTQEVSQDFYDQHLEKSRSRIATRKDETQHTLLEGDEGHVDLVSSFVGQQESEPIDVDFSPTQDRTQPHQRFAESQRFKTPATAGKKRSYNGNTKETPILPRAPLLRSGGTPGMVMGLSQAFADTQAQTSPFVNGTLNPVSDRPSPAIDLDQRPATAPLSSPLRMISEVRNSSAEPAIRYVSVQESQRRRQEERDRQLAEEDTDSDSSFDKPDTQARNWQRTLRKRNRNTRPSPPRKRRKGHSSSPIANDSRSPPPRPQSTPPAPVTPSAADRPDSEAETDQEDEQALEMNSSQRLIDPEDKENIDSAIQIPQTTARPSRTAPAEVVQFSPSLRANQLPPSSAGPLVPNTQISQSASQRVQLKSSTTSGLDFVPQSQDVAEGLTSPGPPQLQEHSSEEDGLGVHQSKEQNVPNFVGKSHALDAGEDVEMQEEPYAGEREANDKQLIEHQQPIKQMQAPMPAHQHTVPETISSRSLAQQTSNVSIEESDPSNLTGTNFETAPSRMPPPDAKAQPGSSPPPSTPRRKHKALSQLENQESPWSQTFNPTSALKDVHDMGILEDLSQSPIAPRKRRKNLQPSNTEVAETESTEKAQIPPTSPEAELDGADELLDSQPAVRPRNVQRTTRSNAERNSIFDIGPTPSPQERILTIKTSARSLRSRAEKRDQTPPTTAKHAEDNPSEASSSDQPKQTQTPKKTPGKPKRREPSVESTSETPASTFHTAPAGDVVAPNAVFACFNGKTRAYYPAWCIGKGSNEGYYTIQWEGYDPEEIDVHGVRSLDLYVGDQVKIDMQGVPKVSHIIHGFKDKLEGEALSTTVTDQRGFKTVLVAPKQRKSLPAGISTDNERDVPISAIYLDSNMWARMKDRAYVYRSPPHSVTLGMATPEVSTPDTPQSRHRRHTGIISIAQPSGMLKNMVFAVSYEDSSRRRELDNLIWSHGGHIVGDEGFADLFEADSMTLKPKYADSGFTALLSDKHSRKPKYLQALALGLPCLSGKWVDACIEKGELVDWIRYLLPAGDCDKLEGAAKSRLMPCVAAEEAKLVEQLRSRDLILQGEKVAVIVGRGKAEAKMKNYLFFIRAMGVDLLEKLPDVRAAKELMDGDDSYSLVFVEREVEAAEAALRAGRSAKKGVVKGKAQAKEKGRWAVSDTERIVQSLIFGARVD